MDKKQRKIAVICGVISLVSSIEACRTTGSNSAQESDLDGFGSGRQAGPTDMARNARDRLKRMFGRHASVDAVVMSVRARGQAVLIDVSDDAACGEVAKFFAANASAFEKNTVGYLYNWKNALKGGAEVTNDAPTSKGGGKSGGKGGAVVDQACQDLPSGITINSAKGGKEGPASTTLDRGSVQIRFVVGGEVKGGWAGKDETKPAKGGGK